MKKVLLVGFMGLIVLLADAQNWNPYVSQGRVSPSPLLPVEFSGTGVISFIVGNSGESLIKLVANQELTLMVTLSSGVPADADPLAGLGGTWAEKFIWNYDSSVQTYTAILNADIPPKSEGTVTIRYKVTFNSRLSSPSNGFNVNLQQPPYTNGVNLTGDDALSAYTFVRALDFGDAPAGYGYATHEINVFKNPGTEAFENYVYLGSLVDPETSDQPSSDADGDDNNLSDDEDGVIFPPLVQGDTVTIPVHLTVHDFGSGELNAWLDWNGDGDFTDDGEKIAGPVAIFETGTVSLTIAVPEKAIVSAPTFARFRVGDNKAREENGPSAWGEVEDFKVTILGSKSMAISGVVTSKSGGDLSETIAPDNVLTFTVTVINTGITSLTNVIINADRIKPGSARCPVLVPGETCLLTGSFTVTRVDRDAGIIAITVTGDSDQTESVIRTEIF